MYLAEKKVFGQTTFYIRESYEQNGSYHSRDLFCLGRSPQQYIIYPGGNAFYIDERVEEKLHSLGKQPSATDLEDLFWPFLTPRVRRALEPFKSRSRRSSCHRRPSRHEKQQLHKQTHVFDKRRLLYLRFGAQAQGYEHRIPIPLVQKIIHKSRDEIEQYFIKAEKILRPHERKVYVYTIFDIQRLFKETIAKKYPQGLHQGQVDRIFVEELCRLNRAPGFFTPAASPSSLHEYLQRYAVMFFDNEFGPSSFYRDYLRDFINRHRAYAPPRPKVDMDAASDILGIKKEILKAMTQEGLNKVYRRRAQKLHPDVGGDHEQFIKLQQAYQQLLNLKNQAGLNKGKNS